MRGVIFMAGYNAASLFALYLLFVFRSALQGLDDTVASMFSGVLELLMRSGSAMLLPLFMRGWGICTAGVISRYGAAALLAFSCRRRLYAVTAECIEVSR